MVEPVPGHVQIENPAYLLQYAKFTRAAARLLLELGGPHHPVGPGPENVFADVDAANDRAHGRFAEVGADAYYGLGGLAWVAEGIGTRFPDVDARNTDNLRGLEAEVLASVPTPPRAVQPDPRFASPAVPR
jgi:hypothetical protein